MESRSQHKSQGFGASILRGEQFEYLEYVKGEKANNSIFDNIDISCTITEVNSQGKAKVEYEYFKKALYPISHIIFYEYNNRYYYPNALEFRLIDNNILYLTEELEINSVEKMFQMLTSSMNKEEQWSNEFVAAIVHLKTKPRFCHKLSQDFTIGNVKREDIYE